MSEPVDLNKTITIGELIEFGKQYDGDGKSKWLESEFEGAEVVSEILWKIFSLDAVDLMHNYFPYTREND